MIAAALVIVLIGLVLLIGWRYRMRPSGEIHLSHEDRLVLSLLEDDRQRNQFWEEGLPVRRVAFQADLEEHRVRQTLEWLASKGLANSCGLQTSEYRFKITPAGEARLHSVRD